MSNHSVDNIAHHDKFVFLDKLVQLFGYKGLHDYETKRTVNDISPDTLASISALVPEMNKLFGASCINLKRHNNKITNAALAFSVLRSCLQKEHIPYDTIRSAKANYLKLAPINNELKAFVRTKQRQEEELKIEKITDLTEFLQSAETDIYYSINTMTPMQCANTNAKIIISDENFVKCITNSGILIDDNVMFEIEIPRHPECYFAYNFRVHYVDSSGIKMNIETLKTEIILNEFIIEECDTIKNAIPIHCFYGLNGKLMITVDLQTFKQLQNAFVEYTAVYISEHMQSRYNVSSPTCFNGLRIGRNIIGPNNRRHADLIKTHQKWIIDSRDKQKMMFELHPPMLCVCNIKLSVDDGIIQKYQLISGGSVLNENICNAKEVDIPQATKTDPLVMQDYHRIELMIKVSKPGACIVLEYDQYSIKEENYDWRHKPYYIWDNVISISGMCGIVPSNLKSTYANVPRFRDLQLTLV